MNLKMILGALGIKQEQVDELIGKVDRAATIIASAPDELDKRLRLHEENIVTRILAELRKDQSNVILAETYERQQEIIAEKTFVGGDYGDQIRSDTGRGECASGSIDRSVA